MRRSKKQRIAISQAEIRKRCKPYMAICQGNRAFRSGIPREDNPHRGGKDQEAWLQGWDIAHDDKQREKENE